MKNEMPRKTRELEEMRKQYDAAKGSIDQFYTQSFLNWNGSFVDPTTGKREVVINRIAEWMDRDRVLEGVKKVVSPKAYLVETHTGKPTTDTKVSTREEELFAMALFKREKKLGQDTCIFLDYQSPIYRKHEKQKNCDESKKPEKKPGKIDLIAASCEREEIYLMELKKYDSKETLLRCVAEIYTYYKQIEEEKLKKEVACEMLLDSCAHYKVVPVVLVFKNKQQHLQYESPLYVNVRKYMDKLGVRLIVIDSEVSYADYNFDDCIEKCVITECN